MRMVKMEEEEKMKLEEEEKVKKDELDNEGEEPGGGRRRNERWKIWR